MSQTKSLNVDYNYTVVRLFAVTTVMWGIVGMGLGVLLAAQLYWPALNFDTAWFTYSRLRPLHTNAVIFAFGTSALFCHILLCGAAYLPGQAFCRKACDVYFYWLASSHYRCNHHLASWV